MFTRFFRDARYIKESAMADTTSGTDSTPTVPKGLPALKQQIMQDKIKIAQWLLRCITIFFTLIFLIPIVGSANFLNKTIYIASMKTQTGIRVSDYTCDRNCSSSINN
ncbi:unnamed protein product [Trichogramma brassicae]|uniref:Uncharacterized protein n=1 Tax=Trichogramma brassicae TaxID=86971 RepID=A0A6H5IC08_9HYME|nr:unnamed protein product [Trichogramma brassicae]